MTQGLGNGASKPKKAALYVRVSSLGQVTRGDGLNSQEATCREYAERNGYAVEEVFRDSVTGGINDRPAMDALLAFVRKRRKEGIVIIVDDLNRFSRDTRGYWELRERVAEAGGKLRSPGEDFGDDADSKLRQNIKVAVAQHQREKNAEQVRGRQRGRLLNGYWPFIACIGLKHVLKPGEGRVLVRDEPCASIIEEAMEGYATGRFRSQAEVKRFFESAPEFPKNRKGEVRATLVNEILTKPLYAGYVGRPEWDVPLRKGRHKGLVSFENFERIQERLRAGSMAPARVDLSEDFPLRGAVVCGCCGGPLTSCWSTSKTGVKHPYYSCFAKACPDRRKSIRRAKIEGEFAELIDSVTPSPRLVELARAMFKDAWKQRDAQTSAHKRAFERQIVEADRQVQALLDRIVAAETSVVVAAFEKRIVEIERAKLVLIEKRDDTTIRRGTFEELFELAFMFLAKPRKFWDFGSIDLRRMVLRLLFSEHLVYGLSEGFRTPKTTFPVSGLGELFGAGQGVAEREGHAPAGRKSPRAH